MTHTITSERYRLGKSIHWNVSYSSLYCSKGMRLQIMLSISLKFFMSILNIHVVKLYLSWEAYVLKFNIIGVKLSDIFVMSSARNESPIDTKIVTKGYWSSPAIEAYDSEAHKRLDNFLHLLSNISKPTAKKSVYMASLTSSPEHEYSDDETEIGFDAVDESPDVSNKVRRVSSVTNYQIEASNYYFILMTTFTRNLLKKKYKKSDAFLTPSINSTRFFEKIFQNSIKLAAERQVVESDGLKGPKSARSLFDCFFKEFNIFYKELLRAGLQLDNWSNLKVTCKKLLLSEFRSIAIKPRINVKNFGILSVDKRDYRGSSVNYFYMILKLKLFLKLLKAKAAKNNTPLKVMSVMWIKKANFLFKSKVKIIYSALIKKKLNAVKRPTVKSRFTKSTPITKKKSGGYSLAKVLKRGAYLRFRPFPFSRLKEFRRLSRSVIGLDKSRKAVVVKNKIFKVQSNFKNYIKRASSRRKLAAKKLKFISRALIFKALIKSIKKSLFANQLKSISTSDALKTLKSNVLYKLFNSNLLNKKTLGRKKSLFLRKVGYSGVKKSLSLKMALMLFSSNFLSNSNFYNWINIRGGVQKISGAPISFQEKAKLWLKDNEGFMDLQNLFCNVFECEVRLKFYSGSVIFTDKLGRKFLKNFSSSFKKVYISKQLAVVLRPGYFYSYLAFRFRAPELITDYLAGALERRRDHYSVFNVFVKLLTHFKLSDFDLVGVRLGLYGRLNGRDRKFRYYVTRGNAPAFRTLDLKVAYAEHQCVGYYGVVHIHLWMYRY